MMGLQQKDKELMFRDRVSPSDEGVVESLVRGTGYFSDEEVCIACELIRERCLKGSESGYEFIFLEREETVVGYGCYGKIPGTMHSFDLYWIVVGSRFQGEGLGKVIVGEIEKRITGLDGCKLYADTSSREQYKFTRGFYERCGFKKEAVLEDFYSQGDGKVIYVKDL